MRTKQGLTPSVPKNTSPEKRVCDTLFQLWRGYFVIKYTMFINFFFNKTSTQM
jgi:hypothetical protein